MFEKDENVSRSEKTESEKDLPNETPPDTNEGEAEAAVEQVLAIKSTKEYKELEDKYLRLAAEFDNYKKRMAREYSRVLETSADEIVRQLLEVVDDFERAISHDSPDSESLKQGMELIYGKTLELLKKRGLKPIEAIGQPFDHNFHDAVMQLDRDDVEDGIIVEEIKKGYLINNRVLRPAQVIVARKKQKSAESQAIGGQSGE
jgi:molecular chaperone GrpE